MPRPLDGNYKQIDLLRFELMNGFIYSIEDYIGTIKMSYY